MLIGCASPEFELADGSKAPLDKYHGEWLLVNYWAVWCKPCIEEIPELNELHNIEGFNVLGFNFDRESGDRLRAQATKLGISFPLLATNPISLFEQKQPGALPATMVISPSGEFHSWLMGPQTKAGIISKLQASH
ncbi:MAG: TlpA family protein disulfide reductase [Oleiphilus sp.]|nr:MAG: TlpA family protein disulfide reductase [Oleiphilus sp.]